MSDLLVPDWPDPPAHTHEGAQAEGEPRELSRRAIYYILSTGLPLRQT